MDNKSLKVLEFDKVLKHLSEYGINQLTKEKILDLKPYSNSEIINKLHSQLDEAVRISLKFGKVPISTIEEINTLIDRANIDSILSPGELLSIASFIRSVNNVIDYAKDIDDLTEFNYLNKNFQSLSDLNQLERIIEKKIKSDSEVADDASRKLQEIRREKVTKSSKIDRTLNRIITNSNNEAYLQDKFISIRNGRYVVPVKKEYKNRIPGTVIDRSSTGSTLFIEPLSVLELNNELFELEIEEQKEIQRIIRDLTNQVKDNYDELNWNYQTYLDLDFLFAKANYALDTSSTQAKINTSDINLKKARHPLIKKEEVVASDIVINSNTKSVVITGPNTGGKTVSLKTLGLLVVMNQAGLFIPVNNNSELRLFDNVFADIGDEQSIEQNLSTFSSHLTNIVEILKNNSGNSLILFDELGAGTDPVEGAALAISILNSLKNTSNLTVATTHYPEIKEYALIEEQVQNASVEFDVNSLRPTYRLIMGIPGRSNAFEIAKRLGLPENIITDSRNRMSKNQLDLSDSLNKAQEELFKANEALRSAKIYEDEARELYKKRKVEIEKTKKQKDRILSQAKEDAKKILSNTKKETDFIYREMQNLQNKTNEKIDNKYLEQLRLGLKNMDNQLDQIKTSESQVLNKEYSLNDFHKGDRVLIKSLNQEVSVTDILEKENKIEISSGSIRMKFKPKELVLLKKKKPKSNSSFKIQRKAKKMDNKLDLRGKTVDEANLLIDNFINDALLLDMNHLEIIHGFGTGQIRRAVHNYLKKSKLVKSYRLGGPGEGGSGATIVEL